MNAAEAIPLLRRLPSAPGVYRFVGTAEESLYIGKARNLKKRVASYFRKRQSARLQLMLAATAHIDATVTASEDEALLLENNLIKSLKPKYNILFRDGKSYPLLRITPHPYPRLMFHRGGGDGGKCFGPFPDSNAVRAAIKVVQKLFRLRTCADSVFANRSRPCLLHAIHRCSAPCINAVSPARYAADVSSAQAFLSGNVKQAATDLQQRMETAAAKEEFEEAAAHRDSLRALNVVRAKHFVDDEQTPDADYIGVHRDDGGACVNVVMVRGGRRVGERRFFPQNTRHCDPAEIVEAFLSQHYRRTPPAKIFLSHKIGDDIASTLNTHLVFARGDKLERVRQADKNAALALAGERAGQASRRQRLRAVAEKLHLPAPPRRIECFDVSHTMGEEAVAARVVFIDGEAAPGEYRRYLIGEAQNNDTASLREAVGRCYRREDSTPDLLLVDGGVGQVRAAMSALAEIDGAAPVVGIAKSAARKAGEETLILSDGEAIKLPPDDEALHLLQAVRDEAHRFAVSGHRHRRDKKRRTSLLEAVEGIGACKRRRLLNHFGGLGGIKAANVADLAKIEGIGACLAERIHREVH